MNNKGQKTSGVVWVIAISLILIAGTVGYLVYNNQTQTQLGDVPAAATAGGTAVPQGCNTEPTVTLNAIDAQQKGTARQIATVYRINDNYVGSTSTFKVGDKVQPLISNSTAWLIATVLPEFTLACGNNPKTVEIYSYNNATISLLNDAGTSTLSDISAAGGTGEINETAFVAGGSKTLELTLTGNDKRSTGNMLYVVEGCTEANVSSMTLSDSNGNAMPKLNQVPSGLTISGNNLERVAFEIPAITSAVKKKFNLNIAMESDKTCNGQPFYTTIYAKQAFVDTDGSFVEGVVDSTGTAKFLEDYDRDFFVALL